MPFSFTDLELPGVRLITPQVFPDARGSFRETFKASAFAAAGIRGPFLQDNLSVSRKGVLRGLHFQKPPHAQAKLIQVLEGAIFDAVVDLRPDSPAFGRWMGLRLGADSPSLLYVPAGFAHGFQVCSDQAVVLYKTSAEFCPAAESGIRWNDPTLAIAWPAPKPLVSARDAALPLFTPGTGSDPAPDRQA